MIDQIEAWEDSAERWAGENMRENEFRCPQCDKWTPLSEAIYINPNPYAPPVCSDCGRDAVNGPEVK